MQNEKVIKFRESPRKVIIYGLTAIVAALIVQVATPALNQKHTVKLSKVSKVLKKRVAITITPKHIKTTFNGIILLSLGLTLIQSLKRVRTSYRVDEASLSIETGILSRNTDNIDMGDIKDFEVKRSLIDLLTGLSNIHLHSTDKTHPKYTMRGISIKNSITASEFIRLNSYNSYAGHTQALDAQKRKPV